MDKYNSLKLAWQQKNIKNSNELSVALNGYVVAFAYHSGKIENAQVTYNDTREIFEHDGVSSYTGDLRTLFEIRNSRDTMNRIFDSFDSKAAITIEWIKNLQYELTKNTYDAKRYQSGKRPGEFKIHDYVTGRDEVGTTPEDVPTELEELLDELCDVIEKNILTAAAYFHLKFENIHPFADGNGRTGRMAMNYFLMMNNHPPIIIHHEDRKEYYKALESWDKKQELADMVQFLKMQTIKTWDKTKEKIKPKRNLKSFMKLR